MATTTTDPGRAVAAARALRTRTDAEQAARWALIGAAALLVSHGVLGVVEVAWAWRTHPSTVYRWFAEWRARTAGASATAATAAGDQAEAACRELLAGLGADDDERSS